MRRNKPSPATLIACLALFVALGGTAVAASRYMITTTTQIAPGVRNSLQAPGPEALESTTEIASSPGERVTVGEAICPAGDHALSGGIFSLELPAGAALAGSHVAASGRSWVVMVTNAPSGVSKFTVDVLCAPGHVTTYLGHNGGKGTD